MPNALHPETQRLHAFLEEVFEARLAQDPEWMSYLGNDARGGEWKDLSDEFAAEQHAQRMANLERMRLEFDPATLDEAGRLSFRLFEAQCARESEAYRWRDHGYLVNQMHGAHTQGPNLLLNVHRVTNAAQAEQYIQRLEGLQHRLAQVESLITSRARMGVLPPKFVFPYVLQDCRNLIAGIPFDGGPDQNVLWADFTDKVQSIQGLDERRRQDLLPPGRDRFAGCGGASF